MRYVLILMTLAAACGKSPSQSSTVADASAKSPFEAGDKIVCQDLQSQTTSTVKFTSTSPLAAYVKFESRDAQRFYPAKLVDRPG